MTQGSDKIEMDSFDYSVYEDCTPLFTGPQRDAWMSFGEYSVPILQGPDNLEKLVFFNWPDPSMAYEGQGLKADIFPVWPPLQLEQSQRPNWRNTIFRRPRTKRSGHRNMNWISQWLNHQGLEANLQSRRPRGRPQKRPDFVLPSGWTTKKVISRKNGKFAWRKDSFYIEGATGHQCRSQPEVTKYLELKARQHG